MPSSTDWRNALKMIPLNIPAVPHGRSVHGVDCVGLVLLIYKMVGIDLSDCDVPYGQREYRQIQPGDAQAKKRREQISRLLQARLCSRFRRLDIKDTIEFRSGDVVLLGEPGIENHVGIFIDGLLIQMGDRLRMRRLQEAWDRKFVTSVFRFVK